MNELIDKQMLIETLAKNLMDYDRDRFPTGQNGDGQWMFAVGYNTALSYAMSIIEKMSSKTSKIRKENEQ